MAFGVDEPLLQSIALDFAFEKQADSLLIGGKVVLMSDVPEAYL
jgi:hypothetical protein